MKFEIIEIFGFKSTLTALRKPFKGQIKSDLNNFDNYNPIIQEDDYKLIKKLIKAGDEHAKCVRGIGITLDITAPRFFWSEHDTYKVGVNPLSSESTMHTLLKEDIDDLEFDEGTSESTIANFKIELLYVQQFLEEKVISKNEAILRLKRNLPESFLQTRTIQYSYQALRRIYFQRRNHRLPHWKEFCNWIKILPMSELITGNYEKD